MKITACGVCYVTSDGQSLTRADDLKPFEISVNGVAATVHVCDTHRVNMAASLHRMLMAGEVAEDETGMVEFMPEDQDHDDDQGDSEEPEEALSAKAAELAAIQDADNRRADGDDQEAEAAKAEVAAKRPAKADNKTIREWAKSRGYQIGDRGGIRAEIVDAYYQNNS